MPLSKQAKALYEAALRRKGLQPGKAVRQDPREFVGPIRTTRVSVPSPYYHPEGHSRPDVVQMPIDTYWQGRGRFQDLEDELMAAKDAGLWESRSPTRTAYRRYYNGGDIPPMPGRADDAFGNYNDPYSYKYYTPRYKGWLDDRNYAHYEYIGDRPHLTRLGERELEARADEAVENDYKDYLRKMYSRWPTREDALREIPFYHAQYLDELYPVR